MDRLNPSLFPLTLKGPNKSPDCQESVWKHNSHYPHILTLYDFGCHLWTQKCRPGNSSEHQRSTIAKNLVKCSPPPMCHVSHVTCQMFCCFLGQSGDAGKL